MFGNRQKNNEEEVCGGYHLLSGFKKMSAIVFAIGMTRRLAGTAEAAQTLATPAVQARPP